MQPLTLGRLESFYVGGTRQSVASPFFGTDKAVFGSMYAQRMAPVKVEFRWPVIFIHGGAHTGVTWESTPDGREGWQSLFVRGGFDTVIIDQPWRGRSAPDLRALMPGVEPPAVLPAAHIAGRKLAEQFDRGGGRFPKERLDHYASQLWPDFGVPKAISRGHPEFSDPVAVAPLAELVDRLGEVVLVTHSQGGDLGWQVAKARPQAVKAIYAIEPALTSPGLDDPGFPRIPVCVVWGDNLPETARTLSQEDVAAGRRIAAERPEVELDLLPEAGIFGNGHMLMMENNSADLAERAMGWLRRQGAG